MKEYRNEIHDEERALYGQDGAKVINCRFDGEADGESALKECKNIEVSECYFNLRYPFWHVDNAVISDSEMTDKCRAAMWYDNNITIKSTLIHGTKALRECKNITLFDDDIISQEFLWRCNGINIENCTLVSEYPFFECSDVNIKNLTMKAKYSFQYVHDMEIEKSDFDTKDAFWHSKNVTVKDSVIKGEYLGWYSENLHLIRCRIIGTQPLCYCKGLVLENCTMENTDLSFERSEVNATVDSHIISVKNIISGKVVAKSIGEIIMEEEFVNPSLSVIICR